MSRGTILIAGALPAATLLMLQELAKETGSEVIVSDTSNDPDPRPGEDWNSYARRCNYTLELPPEDNIDYAALKAHLSRGEKLSSRHAAIPSSMLRKSKRPKR
jgi:hypothetical protein